MNEKQKIEQAIAVLQAQRVLLGNAVVESSIAALREKLAELTVLPQSRQRKQVTLLEADFSGFTALSERMDAEDVRQIMNALWGALDKIIIDHGGTIDKHIGDSVMAFWGMDVAHENDPARAVRAALAMQKEGSALTLQLDVVLPMRIGVHTGQVVFGEIGSQGEFAAVGEAVNLVAALEQAAPVGGIVISPETLQHVRGVFAVDEMSVRAGKLGGARVYTVSAELPRSFLNPTRGVDGVWTRMVGREAELGLLQKTFRGMVTEHALRAMTIGGEAGLGKSRLLSEFLSWVDTTPTGVIYFKARAEEQSQFQPFGLVRELFNSAFQIRESDSKAETLAKFEYGACAFLGRDYIEAAHVLGYLLGYDFSESPYISGIRDQVAQLHARGLYYATQFFQAVARQKPVIILMDDLHWADSGTLEFVDGLARGCQHDQIMLVLATRPVFYEREPAWGTGWPGHARMEIHLLQKADSRILVHEILRSLPTIPASIQDLLLENSDGNPYYLEELIKMLIEQGVILTGEQTWLVNPERLAGVKIPTTLAGVLQARLDRLAPAERDLLQCAAVVGRVFWDEALVAMGKTDQTDAPGPLLDALSAKELVFRQEFSVFENTREYIFKHVILRDVSYELLLKPVRRDYHLRAAGWLILRAGERVNEFSAAIANHFELAGDSSRAAVWYARAADVARSAYSLQVAVDYYRKALDFLSPRARAVERYRLYEGLGDVLRLQARMDEACQAFNMMLALAEEQGDWTRQANALNGLWAVLSRQASYVEALEVSNRAISLARRADPPDWATLAQAIFQVGIVEFRLDHLSEAERCGLESLAISQQAGAKAQIASSYNLLGITNTLLGLYSFAIFYIKNGLEIWREIKHRENEAALLSNLGECYRLSGDPRQALENYQQANKIANDIGDKLNLGGFLVNMCAAYNMLEDYSQAYQYVQDALQGVPGDSFIIAEVHYTTAETYLGMHDLARAASHARDALKLAFRVNAPEMIGHAWRVAGRVASASGGTILLNIDEQDLEFQADACFEKAVERFSSANQDRDRGVALWHWARHKAQSGDRARSSELYAAARGLFEKRELPLLLEMMEKDFSNE